MSSAAIGYHSGDRCDSNKDLVGQGIGNLVAGIVCALSSAGSLVRSFANLNSGARTRWSGVICGLLILLIFITAHPYLSKIPLAVLSGVIVAVGISLFDSLEFAHFTTSLRSKRVRTIEQTRLLQEHGSKIFVIELQGPLFFGSAEEVAKEIETSIQDAEYCIGNMKRISEIDATGARYLLQIYESLNKQGKTLLISHIWEETRLWNSLSYAGIIDEIGRNHFFQDLDSALEYAEDQILCGGLCEISDREFKLAEMDIFAGFSEEEMKIMAGQPSSEIYNGGDVIIRKNDLDRDLFLLIRGMVNIMLKLNNHQREIRLNTLSSGNTFGEIALLDNEPRSANVVAVGEVTLFRWTYDNFLDLQEKKPNVANKLILNIALNLSTRLRLSTEEINVLAEN
jgi:anti-anti-sigma regulatory factor